MELHLYCTLMSSANHRYSHEKADTIILFDLPTEVCLEGAIARIGTKREDLPWVETEETLESGFRQWMEPFSEKQLPEIYALLDNYGEKDIVIFKSGEKADKHAQYYGTTENAN